MSQLKIKNYLKLKGITDVGFSKAKPLISYANFVISRHKLKETYFDIGYEKTLSDVSWYDPGAHLKNAKSIITLILPYKMQRDDNYKDRKLLKLSKASLFKDYHLLLMEQLHDLDQYLTNEFQAKSIAFCDTGPLNDKAIALRSGQFKLLRNSLLWHEKYGTQFYIAYLITDLDLDISDTLYDFDDINHSINQENNRSFNDKFMHPFCSTCGKCQQACPNQAIDEFGHLNSPKCISFLTQSKQWETLNDLTLAGYVYGCDICQVVCPLNIRSDNNKSYENLVSELINIKDIVNLSNREFKNIYSQSSAGWVGKKRFLRNMKVNSEGE